ncbi:uncharacterized protein LOC127861220 [Dreissena polymorpha]|uniref:uncharacterized protein LOC127861220 n=1 Tax=Dreissena polymorpha TaxID=45954 RepID=UPI0022646D84|nr:uncharacterized protein LOC127861220 [Dreissena polymorpha]
MWFNKIVFALMLATVTVHANYYVSNVSTHWSMANCTLAEPQLAYNNSSFYVNESLGLQFNDTDVWVGYRLAKIPFMLIGYGIMNTMRTYTVPSIGYCFNACGGGRFGIKLPLFSVLSNTNTSHGQNCKTKCQTQNKCVAVFSQITASGEVFPNVSNTGGDCMQYFHPRFEWGPCTKYDPIKVMCSNSSHTDESATAVIYVQPLTYNWSKGNALCWDNDKHAASWNSIRRGGFNYNDAQYHWTGIIRSTAIVKRSAVLDNSTCLTDPFAFVINMDGALQIANNGIRAALCIRQDIAPAPSESTAGIVSTNVFFCKNTTSETLTPSGSTSQGPSYGGTTQTSTTESTPDGSTTAVSNTKTSSSQGSSASVGIGIGVAVVILIAVGAVVMIVVLRKRGLLQCRSGLNKPGVGTLAISSRSYEDNVENHNYFILEKSAQSAEGISNHFKRANEPNEENRETDHYNVIDKIEDPYQSVNDDNGEYDYTTNAVTTGPNSRKPKNVYNKIKIDRSGDYDHVGRREHNISPAGNDFDTTALGVINDGVGDYNHISDFASTKFTNA